MRVITGSARGRRLGELEGMETRPTTDRVKEGMFNILQFDIEGRRVLDLFSGTGQLGFECLSRGAAEAVFIDENTAFDLILLDRPYAAGLLEPAIAHIARFDILAAHGIIVAEHPAGMALPALAPPYRLHRTYRYGKIGLTVYRRSGNQDSEESAP